MDSHVVVEFLSGQCEEAKLDKLFDPYGHEICLTFTKDDIKRNFRYSELSCILMNNVPEEVQYALSREDADSSTSLEEIETISGKQFHVRVLDKNVYNTGFFALSITSYSSFKYIYFFFNGFRMRKKYCSTGEILKQNGVLSDFDIEKTLVTQKKLKGRRVGEILVEKNQISFEDVEQIINNNKKKLPLRNLRVGDLLIEENLVTRQQVDEALFSQKKGGKKRVGELLIECGFVTEEQVLRDC